ncbi:MAG TPA: hypothetical protein VJA18_03560 [Candidatus Nanoarchaeia archaeon]|nr:hypothetical protein [Candidatus Nanoarchaeia archaeon]
MKVKKMVKRILAVGAGATMLGATVMGAMAADLSEYPDMFVSDGVFNGLMVVGENAAAVDNLAMTDIAASMKYHGTDSGSTVSVEGDAFLVKSGTDELEFSESIGPAANGVVDFLDSDDLAALADGTFQNSQGSFKYEQFLHFDRAVINTTYAEDDDDVTALFVKVLDNQLFARYELNFLEAAESDVDVSDSFKLDDYEDKTLTMLGRSYNIVKARSADYSGAGAGAVKVTLTLMSGSASDTLLEGESKTYTVDSKEYDASLVFTDSNKRAKFTINGETTPLMDEVDTETLSDGTVIGLSEVLYQDYAGGIHQAEFFLGADKLELEDDSINKSGGTDELKVNDQTIDGAQVDIQGAVVTSWTTSSGSDGELEIDVIQINMTAQEDYFVAAGETLSGQSELTEKELLFTGNWDLRFEGMDESVLTDEIKVADRSGEKEYWLTFTNVKGDVIDFPLAYAVTATGLRFGSQDDSLNLNSSVSAAAGAVYADEQYFILNDDTDEDSVTHVVQYKGADDFATTNPNAKFKILGTGETVERPVTFGLGANGATFNLKLAGSTYAFVNATGGGNVGNDDWNITPSSGGAATSTSDGTGMYNGTGGAGALSNFLITKGGGKIYLFDHQSGNNTADQLQFNVSLIESDGIDDRNSVPYLVKGFNITAAGSEVDLASEIGVTLTSPQDDDDNSYGWSTNGAWVQRNSPSGGGTSADFMKVAWPQKEKLPLVYVTSGAVASSTSAGGNLQAVTFVDATKLDSEVADAKAQNLVVVGGPCVNTVAAELLGSPADCTEGFTPGKARVKLFEHANGNVAMLVAGYSGADTRLAGKVVANRAGELSGKEMVVEGTTYADAKLSKASSSMTQ